MKHFKLKDDSVRTKLHLVDIIFNTPRYVKVYVNGCGHTVYRGDNAAEFAEKLAKEVDAAEEAHIAKLLKQNIEESRKIDTNCTAETEEIKVADNSGEIYNESKRVIFNDDIFAVYVGGDKYNEVRAVNRYDDDILIKRFDNSEQAGAYADKLGRYCDLYAVNKYQLYVYPDEVDFVTVDDGGNDDYAVNVRIGKHKLLAATIGDLHEAFNRKCELEKIFDK